MISAADRARRAQAVAEIFDLMRKRGLSLDELVEIGSQDLESSNAKQVAKAHSVEKTWALMARLSVKFADLEQAPALQLHICCTTGRARARARGLQL